MFADSIFTTFNHLALFSGQSVYFEPISSDFNHITVCFIFITVAIDTISGQHGSYEHQYPPDCWQSLIWT